MPSAAGNFALRSPATAAGTLPPDQEAGVGTLPPPLRIPGHATARVNQFLQYIAITAQFNEAKCSYRSTNCPCWDNGLAT